MGEFSQIFLESLKERVLVFDGAMGTSVHAMDLPLSDFRDLENCSEVLNETRPDVVEQIHKCFLEVGCDAVETNTFGANRIVLVEFDLADQAYELNVAAAKIARQATRVFSTAERPRFVAGSVGPGTRLISLRQVKYDELLDSYIEQIRGLLDGGVDVLLIETCQDILQAKTAVQAARMAFDLCGVRTPIICQVTMETTGRMLMGTDMGAAITALEAFPEIDVIGLNCATGPQKMSEHVHHLSQHCSRFLSVLPNAGLPQIVDGRTHFPLSPEELAKWLRGFAEDDGVNIVGGCCGTTPQHMRAVVDMIKTVSPRERIVTSEPAVSSLYQSVNLRQDTSFLIVGERCNTNGSRAFKNRLTEGDIDGLVKTAQDQVAEGAHVLDVCVDCTGRDGVEDMHTVADRLAADLTAPLMLDSTQPEVIEAGLKLAGGKCIINSVSLEDGGEKLAHVAQLCRQYGAAVVALTIDEDEDEAMAKTCQRKIGIAQRIHALLTHDHGIAEHDIFFDCLTFPITTGNSEDRRLALETLDGVEAVMKRFPNCQSILGVSNCSFGLIPAARVVLNSVFLHEAVQRGLTAAIVHASKILPQNQISDERWQAALDLIYDRHEAGDPLELFMALFSKDEKIGRTIETTDLPVEQRLRLRIIDGQKIGLKQDLDEALKDYSALQIVNDILLDGMKEVGELFGDGRMQLPFVLKSAETMKASVAYLEPHMERAETSERGRIVLATVRGDVHDIGKNLVDIILTNNGYRVYNLGIKQPIGNVITALNNHNADVIGLSGLLVKSALVMREDLKVLREQGITTPVILGGAALTRKFVENDASQEYDGTVRYARDAFEGLKLTGELIAEQLVDIEPSEVDEKEKKATAAAASVARDEQRLTLEAEQRLGLASLETEDEEFVEVSHSDIGHDYPVPYPPFWGSRVIDQIDMAAVLAYLNDRMLFQVQWGFRRQRRSNAEWRAYVEEVIHPIYRELVVRCCQEQIMKPKAVYGYWPANSDGNDLVVFAPPTGTIGRPEHHGDEIARFPFPRQRKHPHWCLADFFRPVSAGVPDVAAFSLVTMGTRVSEVTREWFEADKYQEYVFLHGLAVEAAEALAEYIHKQVRSELGVAGQDAQRLQKLFQQGYQGSRYSFGYPACPELEQQTMLMDLLEANRIGIELTEGYQLVPEQSTSAVITYHPDARYFSV